MQTEKKIEDYTHLYIGCEVFGTYSDQSGSKGYLSGVTNGGTECEIQFFLEDGINVEEDPVWNDVKEIKLILRPLSDMTIEECGYCKIPPHWSNEDLHELIDEEAWTCEQVRYMLSKHFDLFGLIEAGLAIDKTTLV